MSNFEKDYLDLLDEVRRTGYESEDRTGIGTKKLIGKSLTAHHVGSEHSRCGFPIPETRPFSFRISFWETMMFLQGITDTKYLEDKGINIWKGNTSREFLDNRGLFDYPEGEMGPGYGFQWRDFGGGNTFVGTDQVSSVLKSLKEDPFGRRHIISAWNPNQLNLMALPPCHIINQYFVTKGADDRFYLDSIFYMRSVDLPFGLPYNMMSYSFMNILFAKMLGYQTGHVTFMGGDCHIYNNQMDMVYEQVSRFNQPLTDWLDCKLHINADIKTPDDFHKLNEDNVILSNYHPMSKIASTPKMAI